MVTPDTVPLCARPSVFSVAKDDKGKREVASSFKQEKQMKKQSSFDMVNPLAKNKLAKNKPVPAQPHCADSARGPAGRHVARCPRPASGPGRAAERLQG